MEEMSARGLAEQGKHCLHPAACLALRHGHGVEERQTATASGEAVPQQLVQGSYSKQRQEPRAPGFNEDNRKDRKERRKSSAQKAQSKRRAGPEHGFASLHFAAPVPALVLASPLSSELGSALLGEAASHILGTVSTRATQLPPSLSLSLFFSLSLSLSLCLSLSLSLFFVRVEARGVTPCPGASAPHQMF